MKTKLLTLLAALLLATALHAHEKITAGPNGGRVLAAAGAEFLVTKDRKVQITFLDSAGKPVAPADQVVTVIAGERSAPTKLTFVKSGEALISEQELPGGDNFPAVVQIRTNPEAKPATDKFNLNLAICPGCKRAEYVCTCEH